jgi:hypothetical protein
MWEKKELKEKFKILKANLLGYQVVPEAMMTLV